VLPAICLDNRGFEARYDIGIGVVWCGVVWWAVQCSAVIEIYWCLELHSNMMLCTAVRWDAMGYLADSRGTGGRKEKRKKGRIVRFH
jgi:hypothetical protein